MKANDFIRDSQRIFCYSAGYTFTGGIGNFDLEVLEEVTFAEEVEDACGELGIKGSYSVVPGAWFGYKLGEAEIEEGADEDGLYLHRDIYGQILILSEEGLDVNNLAGLCFGVINDAAGEAIDEEQEAFADLNEYQRDPYAYYGLRRSDFY